MDVFLHTFLQQFQHLKIDLKEITTATNNFNKEKLIRRGGFGKVYKGEVSHCKGRSMVAIKCLDKAYGQGIPEFLKEITMLSSCKHENLISLLGFCCEGSYKLLVYELASRGSLDRRLNSPDLTWSQRLKICLDVAKGLSYIHDPRGTHQRIIHCDIKSSNILLDDQWNAKLSDFGLSIMGSANEQRSLIITLAAGTHGYLDPQYEMTNTLTKESDVYSFGVVLFEVLCGRLCCIYDRDGRVQQAFLPGWKESYKQKTLNDIIFKSLTIQPLDQSALETFSDIAYECLKGSREDRPNMAEVVTKLETAYESQKFSEWKPLFDYEEITKTAEPRLNYSCKGELWKLLSKGVLEHKDQKLDMQPISDSDANWEEKLPVDYENIMRLSKQSVQWTTKKEVYSIICKGFLINDGQEWFSLDKNGKRCHMLSTRAASIEGRMYTHLSSLPESRFGEAFEFSLWRLVTSTTIKSHLLSSQTTYASYLVYKLPTDQSRFEAPVKVKDLGSDHICYIYLVNPQIPGISPKADQDTHNPLSRPKLKGLPQ